MAPSTFTPARRRRTSSARRRSAPHCHRTARASKSQYRAVLSRRRADRHRASINIAAQIDTGTTTPVYLPGDYTSPEFTITDPATLAVQAPTHKVAIVYSDTTAALYFSQTAYSDLFMAAQNQARMAGVSYDIIDESQLTNINNLNWLRCNNIPVDGGREYRATAGNHLDTDQRSLQLPHRHHYRRRLSYQRPDGCSASRQLVLQHGDPAGARPVHQREQRGRNGHRERRHQYDHEGLHRRSGHPDLRQ